MPLQKNKPTNVDIEGIDADKVASKIEESLPGKPVVEKSKEIATVKNEMVASGMNEEDLEMLGSQSEHVDKHVELQFSRLALLQPLSPEVAADEAGYEKGMIVNNVTREVLSSKIKPPWLKGKVQDDKIIETHCLPILVVRKLPSEFIKWKNRNTEGVGMHWKTLDPTEERVIEGTWPPRGRFRPAPDAVSKAPPVTENINLFCLPLSCEDFTPINDFLVATFAKTNYRSGKKIVQFIQFLTSQKRWAWEQLWWIYSKLEDDGKNKYYVLNVAPGPQLSKLDVAEPLFNLCKQQYRAFWDKTPSDIHEGKTKGQVWEETVINSASLQEDEFSTESSEAEEMNPDGPGQGDPF